MSHRRRRLVNGGAAPFDPSALSGGVITAWGPVPRATVTGLGVSSMPDALNSPDTWVQTTDARRPPLGTSANGLPVLAMVDDALLITPNAGNNHLTKWGFATHVALDGAVARTLLRMGVGASALGATDSLYIEIPANGEMRCHVNIDAGGTNRRLALTNPGIFTSSYQFLVIYYDGAQATDALKWRVWLDGVAQVQAFFAEGVAAAMPVALQGAPAGSGNIVLGNLRSDISSTPMIGRVGPNIYFTSGAMASPVIGPFTTAVHTALAAHQRPT